MNIFNDDSLQTPTLPSLPFERFLFEGFIFFLTTVFEKSMTFFDFFRSSNTYSFCAILEIFRYQHYDRLKNFLCPISVL